MMQFCYILLFKEYEYLDLPKLHLQEPMAPNSRTEKDIKIHPAVWTQNNVFDSLRNAIT